MRVITRSNTVSVEFAGFSSQASRLMFEVGSDAHEPLLNSGEAHRAGRASRLGPWLKLKKPGSMVATPEVNLTVPCICVLSGRRPWGRR